MTFRTAFTLAVFVVFVGLSGFELAGQFMTSAKRDIESVRYVRGLDAPVKDERKPETFDLNKILEETDVDG